MLSKGEKLLDGCMFFALPNLHLIEKIIPLFLYVSHNVFRGRTLTNNLTNII